MRKIAAWLAEIGLAKHDETFRANDIDFDVLSSLGEDELKELGLSLGDRKRLLRAIGDLDKATDEASPVSPLPATGIALSPERRQLTVVFVDLVDSTALSQVLDPEDLRDMIRRYHGAVAGTIRDGGGFVAKFMGDGVLAYFGYPQAAEDAAERAVRASLRVVAAVRALPPAGGRPSSARVGVATGPVVVGDVMGEDIAREVNVVGETPNLAARLLGICRPDRVVIAEATRRIVGNLFSLTALEAQTLKGIAEPVLAFEVTGERLGLSRFEATRSAERSQFFGRGQEVALLLDRWEQAKTGDGQLVLLSGEAGIGKSRIIEAMTQQLGGDRSHRIRYQCTPQHANSPLYPATTQLAVAAGLQPEDDADSGIARIRAAMPHATEEQAMLVASLLGVPVLESSSLEALAPTRRRQMTLDAFAIHLDVMCRQPVLLLIEDVHWIDPTTEELVTRFVEKAGTQKLLIVVTHRPEYLPPWSSAPIATQIPLNRLSRSHAFAMLESLGGGKTLPPEAVEYIIAHTDGVPLYVEELFRALCDAGTLEETATAFVLARPLEGTAVPATLQDSLMARLDRLAPAKAVAQLGASIGREFGHELLSAVAGMSADVMNEGLAQLLASGMIFARGAAPDVIYTFKHALIQDAAYGSMLKDRRQAAHGRIARSLAGRTQETRPEVLAFHFEAAGESEYAATWFDRAGDAAARASANREATRFWRAALRLSGELADRDLRRWDINLKQKLGSALVRIEGYSSRSALEAYDEALKLALDLEDTELYIGTFNGLSPLLGARQDFVRIERLLAQVPVADLPNLSATAQGGYWYRHGATNCHLGRPLMGRRDLQQAIAVLKDAPAATDRTFHGGDMRVAARIYLSRANLSLGLQEQADRIANEGIALAREIDEPFSVAWALITSGRCNILGGNFSDALPLLAESIETCGRFGFAARLGQAHIMHGCAMAALGEIPAGVLDLKQGFEMWRQSSGSYNLENMLLDAADILIQKSRLELARPYWDEAGRYYATGPERGSYAEYFRMDGVLRAAAGDRASARGKFQEAIDIAEGQGANRFRLRAGRDLARLLAEGGEVVAARDLLAPIYASFTEGFDAPDVKEAKALLDELSIE